MSEQKMREALELAILTMQRNVMKDCNHGQTSGLYAAIFKCQEALAQQPVEAVELTDAECGEILLKMFPMSQRVPRGWLGYARAVIAAHEAKRNGGAA